VDEARRAWRTTVAWSVDVYAKVGSSPIAVP
jgi:hypothetical protein